MRALLPRNDRSIRRSFIVHCVDQSTDLLNLHSNIVAVFQDDLGVSHGPNTGSCACHNYRALLKGGALGEEGDNLGDGKYHLTITDSSPGKQTPLVDESITRSTYRVFESCTVLPLWIALIWSWCGSLMADGETRMGPMGQERSNPIDDVKYLRGVNRKAEYWREQDDTTYLWNTTTGYS